MSFNSEYEALRKKRKKTAEEEAEAVKQSLAAEYAALRERRLKREEEKIDEELSPTTRPAAKTSGSSFASDLEQRKREKELESGKAIGPVIGNNAALSVLNMVRGGELNPEERASPVGGKNGFFENLEDAWDYVYNSAMSGLGQFNKGLTATLDVILGNPLQALGWEDNPISELAEYYSGEADEWKERKEAATEELGGGKLLETGGDIIEGATAALPNAILAVMTAGSSTAVSTGAAVGNATSATLAQQAAWNTSNVLGKAGLTVQGMVQNPQFWTSFAQTYGNDYNEALEKMEDREGWSDTEKQLAATFGATISSLVNSGIEIGLTGGSGFQGLPDKVAKGGKSAIFEWAQSSIEEGGEEVLQGTVSRLVSNALYGTDEDVLDLKTMGQEFGMGAAVGGVLGGGQIAVMNAADSIKNRTSNKLTAEEQSVVDKEVEARIAEVEKDGNKLTKSQKNKIYNEVLSDLDKGYISIDRIEETLGGDTYSHLTELTKQEEADIEQFKKMYEGEELQKRIDEYLAESKKGELQTQLSDEVYNLVSQSRLSESYNEKMRSGVRFSVSEETLAKYGKKYRGTFQRAMESGVLNNTRRSYELVELVAKLEADKGAKFDFANNKKLAELGFSVEGATVNGVVDADGNIKLNVESNKYLNTVAGHEIAHVLEGTDLYDTFKSAVFEYAKTKGEYDSRYAAIDKLYRDKDGYKGQDGQRKIENELAADLVGDYLFTDADFIKNLSTKNRNLFEKIYDEIKYLYKTVTAGSKEARQLEKVKKAFEDAYRADTTVKTNESTAPVYSLSDPKADQKYLDAVKRGDMETAKKMVEDAAKETGYTVRAMHGTNSFGFTVADVTMSDDGISFFATDADETALSYSSGVGKKQIADAGKGIDAKSLESVKADVNKLVSDYMKDGYYLVGEVKWADVNEISAKVDEIFAEVEKGVPSAEVADKLDAYLGELEQSLAKAYYNDTFQGIMSYEQFLKSEEIGKWPEKIHEVPDKIRDVFSRVESWSQGGVYDLFVNTDGHLVIDAKGSSWDNISADAIPKSWFSNLFGKGNEALTTRDVAKYAKRKGYTGVTFKNLVDSGNAQSVNPATVYVFFNPQAQVKSADAVTYDDNGDVIPLSERFNKKNADMRYSLSDSDGNIKDTSAGYSYGESYYTMSFEQDGKVVGTLEYGEYDGSPNVKMIEVDPEYRRQGIGTKLLQELQKKYPNTEIDFGMATEDGVKLIENATYTVENKEVSQKLARIEEIKQKLAEYDRVLEDFYENDIEIPDHEHFASDYNELHDEMVALQMEIRGKSKTKTFVKTDTRYSLSDSDGKQLTNGQQTFFQNSKMRDENGNLKVMYHGSQDAGFHVFDSSMSDDGTSFFFVDRNDVAASYSGTTETYEARTIRTAEDMNNFLAEIGYDQYEATEKDGKFELLENGEHITTKDTAQEIYEEFCWYEGVGEGDANYKVYLNLTNPLEIDAKGKNWNNIGREFSQELANKYKSLTKDERAALLDLAEWGDFQTFRDEILSVLEQQSVAPIGADYQYLANAVNKLGGNNINITNLFSIASDNFSAESIKEFAVKQMNTRDYAKMAKEQGYDGVIFRNLHDNGGYSNGSEGASTVAIAFESNQIKSVANENPTGNEDIRYSLSEYTEEEKKAHNKAVLDHFGRTYKWAETGYVLLDGSKLDLSGKHEGAPGGYRTVDHRDIVDALGSEYGGDSYSGSLIQFMSEGNIRISPESNGINLSVKPNRAQEQALFDFISKARGEILLDIDDFDGYTVVSVEYPRGTYAKKVLTDIQEWFDNGKEPQISNLSPFRNSLSKKGATPKRYGDLAISGEDVRYKGADISPIAESAQASTENVQKPDADALFEEWKALRSVKNRTEAQNLRLAELKKQIAAKDRVAKTPASESELRGVLADDIAPIDPEAQTALDMERLDSLDDSNMPPEVEAPYYEDSDAPAELKNPFDERDYYDSLQKTKPFMEENPEVIPYFKEAALGMLYDVRNSTKGERYAINDSDGYIVGWDGTKRHTTDDIAALRDGQYGYLYKDIEDALNRIVEGEKLNTLAKRLEWDLHNRLVNGYTDIDGNNVPPNQDYIDLMRFKQETDEAYRQYQESVEYMDDSFAPIAEEIKPVPNAETPIKNAPVVQQNPATVVKGDEKIARVLTEEPEAVTEARSGWQYFMRNFVDKKAVFEKVALETGNRELQARADALHRADASAQYLMKNGDKAAGVKSLDEIRKTVQKSGKEEDFSYYVYHVHNIDRMSLESRVAPKIAELQEQLKGYSEEQIKSLSEEFVKRNTPKGDAARIRAAREYVRLQGFRDKPVFGDSVTADVSRQEAAKFEKNNPEFKEWAQDLYDYTNNLRGMMVEEGIISQETAELWSSLYPHYVPIRRDGKNGAAINVALDTNKTGINAPIQRATGGNADILPLFDTLGTRTVQTFNAIAKNRFGVELKNTLKSTVAKSKPSFKDAINSVENHEGLLKEGKDGMMPTFTVFENGERVEFEITEDMFDAMRPASKALSRPVKPDKDASLKKKAKYALKIAPEKINNFRRGVLTEYNPYFMLTNAAKDVQDILVNSQHSAKTYANLPVALKEILSNGEHYQEYLRNGGDQISYFERETNTFEKEKSTLRKVVGFPLDAISAANNLVERLPRLAEYIASRKAGRSEDVSMLDAARVTTNFAAGGDVTKFANRNGFTFLNASVQGAAQQIRNIREAKHKGLRGWVGLAAKYAIAGLPAMLLNSMLWGDDDDYEELSDYVKQDYYIVGKNDDGTFIRIPKGRALAVIQNAFEQIGNLITGDDEVDFGQFFGLVVNNLAPNNPIDNNIISPFVQAATNTTWYGEDLVPSRLQDLPAGEQYDESTDAFSKWLGEVTGISPYKTNYLLDQYSGVLGDMFLPALTPDAERGDGNVFTAPFLDKFTTDPVMKNQNVSDFYTLKEELTVNANGSKATAEDILKSKYINSINSELSELYAKKREIQNDTAFSDADKYAEVRALQQQIVDLAKEALNSYEDVSIQGTYATVGGVPYRWYEPGEDSTGEAGWKKLSAKQTEKQNDVINYLGITEAEYWSNKEEYDYAYEYPEKYSVAKAMGGYASYKSYSSDLYDIKADKDSSGKSINGSRKEKVLDYINNLDADYGEKIILFKSEYPSDDTYNYEIIEYLNGRDDISYSEMETILKELGFTVYSDGRVTW